MAQFFTNSATLWIATTIQGLLVDSKMRLWQAGLVTISIATTRAQLVAAEATYTGYPVAGVVLPLWFSPLLNPLGGASIDSPKVQFEAAAPYTTGNNIGGYWVEDENGQVVVVGSFAEPIPIGAAEQGFPISVALVFPN
jgi:hypothetical protein